MRRRDLLAGLCAGVARSIAAQAQRYDRIYHIALLAPFPIPSDEFDDLKTDGFVEGRNLLVDRRGVGIAITEFGAAAAELVKTNPDAIVTWGPAAASAAKRATKSIPIVAFGGDPVAMRFAASMSQPGGNLTGVSVLSEQLDTKRLEILHEVVPSAQRIGVLAAYRGREGEGQIEAIGQTLGLQLIVQEVRNADEIERSIDALAAAQVAAINVSGAAIFWAGRNLILSRTAALGLPTMYFWRSFAQEGGLVSFGPSQKEARRLLTQQLLRVLNGAAPATLPIVQPTKFELVINLKTAKALGLTIPPSMLAVADEVIE
jgi:putative ABC transport system substrate-binding protein